MSSIKPVGYVYLTVNLNNGKRYIGQHRVKNARFDPKYLGTGKLIQQAVRKYGPQNFSVEALEWCDTLHDLNEAEKWHVEAHGADKSPLYYNLCPGGFNGAGSMVKSEEHKRKIGAANKGKVRSGQALTNIHASHERHRLSGYKHSEETLKKMRKPRRAFPATHGENVSKAKTGVKHSAAHREANARAKQEAHLAKIEAASAEWLRRFDELCPPGALDRLRLAV